MRRLAFAARLIPLLPAILLVLPLSAWTQSEVITFEDAKSTLVVAILKNTTWSNEAAIDGFVIGVYGDDRELLHALKRDMSGTLVRGKSVSVASFGSLAAARAAHILLLPPRENSRLAEINRELRQSQTLIVTDDAEDKQSIMVNFTYPTKLTVAFEINARNLIDGGLTPSREVLMFGGSKLDLANIYRESEQQLEQARAVAVEQQRRLQDQQKQLTEQGATIARQLEAMAANRRELENFERQLSGVQEILQDSVEMLGDNARELKEKESLLSEKEARLASSTQQLEENLQRLDAQQQAIAEQERQIQEQGSVLVSQLSTIENQRFILLSTLAVLLFVLLLIALTFRAYRSKHRLATALEGKTRELEIANEKLLEVTEAKSRFLSTMSHEIRTPMNGVIGMAELLEGTHLTSQQDEYVSLILKSADTLLGLINDILDFSKIEAGHLDLEAIPFNLRDVLGDTLQTLALRADEKGIELTFHIPPEVPDRLVGDALRLRQIAVNLVGNAIKFTDAGEVAVDLSLESKEETARIRFEVRDTGIGITEAQQRKIFEAFGQADSSTTRQFGGTGLGLSIAVQLVQMMGGTLAVSSEIGQGSSFYFTAEFALPEGPEPVALQPEELHGLRALVVDDNDTNCMILDELLTCWGMSVRVVKGGEEALAAVELAEEEGMLFAIALLDVMMPHMDGFELAEKIRQRPAHGAMRILMLTSAGRSNTEDIRERLDISRVLLKPTKHSNLQRAVTDALGVTPDSTEDKPSEIASTITPRSVLLVEDNPVNRRVATEVLGQRGHRVEVASNGREAVDATARQEFDVVLMDVHMPVMDGLTATRIIREREHGSGTHLPIIALTAGATVEDRENSISAGMDNFVTKPFRGQDLIRAVEAVAACVSVELPAQRIAPPATGVGGDEPCLDWDGALRNLEGDEEFLCELAEMFLAQYPAILRTIEETISSASGEELQHAAHSLKGSSQVIGGRAVAAIALQLESFGRAANIADAGPALLRLKASLADLEDALAAALPAQQS